MAIDDYLNLVPSQHRQRPRYMATVEAVLRPAEGVAGLLEAMRTLFDLDTALGAQLDAVRRARGPEPASAYAAGRRIFLLE
jgi:hypothetical protein